MLDTAEPPLIPTWVAVVVALVALLAVIIFIIWLYLMARKQWNLGVPQPVANEKKEERDHE